MRNSRLAGAKLIGKTAKAIHYLTWVTWIAKNDPIGFSYDLIKEHDAKMTRLYPEIVEAQVELAAHDRKLYDETQAIVNIMYNCDSELGRLAIEFKSGDKSAVDRIGKMWRTVADFSLEMPDKFAKILHKISD